MYFQIDNSARLPKFFKDHTKVDITQAVSYYNIWACLYKRCPKAILVTKWDDQYIYGVDLSKIKLTEIDALFYEIFKHINESEFDTFPKGIDKSVASLIETFAHKVSYKWKRKSFDVALYISAHEAFNLAALMKQ